MHFKGLKSGDLLTFSNFKDTTPLPAVSQINSLTLQVAVPVIENREITCRTTHACQQITFKLPRQ